MKTKVFETGAVCAAVALLFVLSLPAYAKSGGSTSAHTRVGKTPSNAVGKASDFIAKDAIRNNAKKGRDSSR